MKGCVLDVNYKGLGFEQGTFCTLVLRVVEMFVQKFSCRKFLVKGNIF